jgi:hypothetical protein
MGARDLINDGWLPLVGFLRLGANSTLYEVSGSSRCQQ